MQTQEQNKQFTDQEPQTTGQARATRLFQNVHGLPVWMMMALVVSLLLIYWDQGDSLFLVAGLPREAANSLVGLGVKTALARESPRGWVVTAISDSSGNPTDPAPDPPPED